MRNDTQGTIHKGRIHKGRILGSGAWERYLESGLAPAFIVSNKLS
jgi:hypothetical protein